MVDQALKWNSVSKADKDLYRLYYAYMTHEDDTVRVVDPSQHPQYV